jgi:hypothetical protein
MPRPCTSLLLLAVIAAPSLAHAQGKPLPPAQQIAGAILPLPKEFRESATVFGYDDAHKLITLREGKGEMNCLADDPAIKGFHAACYHKALEPFMARGRALRASGVKGAQVDTVRFAEIKGNTLAMPRTPSSLYTLTGPDDAFDAATGTASKASPLHVVYIPFATPQTSGISAIPNEKTPWLMYPGTPKAHIMFSPGM